MKLIVDLGNPGAKYAGTRHNVGFMVAEKLAQKAGISLKKAGHQGIYGIGRAAGQEVAVLLPLTYMNLSGVSVGSACKALGIAPPDLIVIHDDVDLPFGALRLRSGGGHGGHNGVRNIREVLGSGDFTRVKIGVGRPEPAREDVAGYVLSPFSSAEKKSLGPLLDHAVEALEVLLERGLPAAMNEYNSLDGTR